MLRSTLTCTFVVFTAFPAVAEEVNFNRDVRPILAAKCFACHGPDEETREADLRLDQREVAVELGAIKPGDVAASNLIQRMNSDDPDLRMPPPAADATLSDAQRQTLTKWIREGARYDVHWAFVPPQSPPLPEVKAAAWGRNEIDRFVLARLEAEGLSAARAAEKMKLVRRVHLDLIGLPPTVAEADAFVADSNPKAYERLVDRLLKSPHYGERSAHLWLDLARYSDTNGYEKDRNRSIWPYRDWVIRALNDDMPFDRFSIEQLAGDMLPNASQSQRVATGFHRNTMLNEEGGIDPLEYRFYAMVDRIATTGTVWLGMTIGCAQCHSHKYDPITHTDYYSLMALLNNADEPDLRVRSPELMAREAQLQGRIEALEKELANQFPPADEEGSVEQRRAANLKARFQAWGDAQRATATHWQVITPGDWETNSPKLEVLPDGSIFSSGDITKRDVFTLRFKDLPATPVTAIRLEALPDERLPAGGPGRTFYEGRKGDFFLSELSASSADQPLGFRGGSHSYGKISIGSGKADAANVFDREGSTGWSTSGNEGRAQLVLNLAEPLVLKDGLTIELFFERHFAASLGRFRFAVTCDDHEVAATSLAADTEALFAKREPWTEAERARVLRTYLLEAPELAAARKQIDAMRKQLPNYPTSMVMLERLADNPRPTYRHHRGEYLSPREQVEPGIPQVFAHLLESQPANRLEFARWLVSDQNPLAARVAVNRAWRAFFGHGLMRTSGDFGTQSDAPTHPELLDWLADDFARHGWSMKRLHKQIVMSATYRQESAASAEDMQRDPSNRLLARGPRFRLDAEMVRDTLLHACGLLSAKMYGASVFPPQPGAVTGLAYGGTAWRASTGEDRYRRSLYTFSKRTAPFAAYTVFDGPTGETCTARRNRSNTPLQVLTLLNDDMFLEYARAAAKRLDPEASAADRISTVFRNVLTRPPVDEELKVLLTFQRQVYERLAAGELDATQIAKEQNASELASWVLLARVIMVLDEAITKQ